LVVVIIVIIVVSGVRDRVSKIKRKEKNK